jgi:hypothetical protein
VSEEEQLIQRMKLIETALGLGLTIWCLWMMIPDHRKRQWVMRILLTGRRWAGTAASRTGAASMRAELATGHQNYALTYGFSMVREHLAVMYDRTRGVTP